MRTQDLRLRLARTAQRQGRNDHAATLYAQVLCANPYVVEAWWGLSQIVCDPDRVLFCLKRVLDLEPCHAEARCRLDRLNRATTAARLENGKAHDFAFVTHRAPAR
jgi:hypothetical protein